MVLRCTLRRRAACMRALRSTPSATFDVVLAFAEVAGVKDKKLLWMSLLPLVARCSYSLLPSVRHFESSPMQWARWFRKLRDTSYTLACRAMQSELQMQVFSLSEDVCCTHIRFL